MAASSVLTHKARPETRLRNQTYSIKCAFSEDAIPRFEQLLKQRNLKFKLTNQIKEGNDLTTT